jgi:lipopolysaccharide biosynthesis glycosyltransferase
MIAVTLGVGPVWEDVARFSAARMAAMTGLRTEVVTEVPAGLAHPSWAKCSLLEMFPEEDGFLYFDADLVAMKPWQPELLWESYGRGFCAVAEPYGKAVDMECQSYGLNPGRYINAGLLLFGPAHAWIWERTLSRHPRFGSWYEQTALNVALQEEGPGPRRLPAAYNALAHHGRFLPGYAGVEERDAINVHYCSVNDPVKLLKLQERHPL